MSSLVCDTGYFQTAEMYCRIMSSYQKNTMLHSPSLPILRIFPHLLAGGEPTCMIVTITKWLLGMYSIN